jgi:predicted metal-dependent phosphoesterase TrpH
MSIIDMHIHLINRSRCSKLAPEQIQHSISNRIDGICITDHFIVAPLRSLNSFGIEVAFGSEISSVSGHILAYGITSVPSKHLNTKEVIKFIHNQGGVAVAAHLYSPNHVTQESMKDDVFNYEFDAIEINGSVAKKYNKLARIAAQIMDIPTIGGSDAHSVNQLNTFGTLFKNPIKNIHDIVKGIKTKQCRAMRI